MYDNGTKIKLSIGKKGSDKMQKKLILLMKENHVTNKDLANKLGISEKQMGYKLKGETDFKSTEMFQIANFFGKTINDIFLPSMYENGTNLNQPEQKE